MVEEFEKVTMKKLNLLAIIGVFILLLLELNFQTTAENRRIDAQTPTPTPIICLPDPIELDKSEVFLSCAKNTESQLGNCGDSIVGVMATAVHPRKQFTYKYAVSAGKVIGKGRRVDWDLSDAKEGSQTIKLTVIDGKKVLTKYTKVVTVRHCKSCP